MVRLAYGLGRILPPAAAVAMGIAYAPAGPPAWSVAALVAAGAAVGWFAMAQIEGRVGVRAARASSSSPGIRQPSPLLSAYRAAMSVLRSTGAVFEGGSGMLWIMVILLLVLLALGASG
jgi:hypothetical protein